MKNFNFYFEKLNDMDKVLFTAYCLNLVLFIWALFTTFSHGLTQDVTFNALVFMIGFLLPGVTTLSLIKNKPLIRVIAKAVNTIIAFLIIGPILLSFMSMFMGHAVIKGSAYIYLAFLCAVINLKLLFRKNLSGD